MGVQFNISQNISIYTLALCALCKINRSPQLALRLGQGTSSAGVTKIAPINSHGSPSS